MPLSARLTLIYQNHIPAIDTYSLGSSQLFTSCFLKQHMKLLVYAIKLFLEV